MDIASSDLVLRCYAPQMLVEAYRRAQSTVGDARERLGWRLGFADLVQRYVVAVLAAEHAGLELAPPEAYLKLINKLDTPSLGDWAQAAEALAGNILASGKALVAPEFASLLLTREPVGALAKSPVAEHLKRLIDLRNTLFHRDGAPLPDEATAHECLKQIEGPLRTVCEALRFLHDYPLLYVSSSEELQDGSEVVGVLRFSGPEPERLAQPSDGRELKVPTRVPFLVSRCGDILMLAPFVVVARNEASGLLEARVLYGWNGGEKCFEYSALHGGERSPARTEGPSFIKTREDLRQLKAAAMRRSGAVALPAASRLAEAAPSGERVTLPGLKLQGKLGAGASSTVYLAREVLEGRPPSQLIAVKVLRPIVATDPLQRQRLRMEHELLAGLNHPCIVKVLEYRDEPLPHLIMEYVKGEDLQSAVERKPLAVNRAVGICIDVLDALEAAHGSGAVHRDVKPSNILVDQTERTRLIDFGIATAEHLARQTRTLDAVGTVAFAAPEQLQRTREIDHRADLYAVGRVLEFLVTGALGPMGVISEKLPPGLHAVIRKATQAAPEHRFQSAAAMRDALQERQQAQWGGAPVQMGDRLNDSYELHDLRGEHEGIWAFDGAELASDERVTIALTTVGSKSETRLASALKVCPPSVRAVLGNPRLERTADQLLFSTMAPGAPLEMLEALLSARAPVRKAPVAKTETLERVPAYMAGFSACIHIIERSDAVSFDARAVQILQVTEYARRALLATMVGFFRQQQTETPLHSWGALTMRSLEGLISSLMRLDLRMMEEWDAPLRADMSALLGLAPALHELSTVRNQVAHLRLNEPEILTVRAFVRPFRALLEIGSRVLSRLPETALAPFMTRMSDGEWALLELRGTQVQYVSLMSLNETYTAPPDVVALLAPPESAKAPAASRGEWYARSRKLENQVEQEVKAWPHVGRLERDATTIVHGHTYRTDFLARARGSDTPIFVIRCVLEILRKNLPNRLNELGSSAMGFKVPFAALTTGQIWLWYRFDKDKGLLRLTDDQEVQAYVKILRRHS